MLMYFRNGLYIFIVFLFLVFLSIANISPFERQENVVYLYTLILFPLYDRLLQVFENEKIFSENFGNWKESLSSYTIFGGVIMLSWYMGQSLSGVVLISTAVFGLLFGLNAKVSFFTALVFLLYVPFFLILGDSGLAESLSIYVYYFLVIGLLLELRTGIYPKIQKLGK